MTRSALALSLVLALLPLASAAQVVVLDYDAAPTPDFETTSYVEDGVLTAVHAGHYEIVADALGSDGDHAFNIDEQNLGLTTVRIQPVGGSVFNALSLEVVNPASAPGEVTIAAVGGPGSVSAPTVGGPFELGSGFTQITALEITQHQPGAFAFDDVVLPEPGRAVSFLALAGFVLALRGARRSATAS